VSLLHRSSVLHRLARIFPSAAKPPPPWSARTCPRFRQATRRRRMRAGVQLSRAAGRGPLWRQVAKAAKAVTSHRTPNSCRLCAKVHHCIIPADVRRRMEPTGRRIRLLTSAATRCGRFMRVVNDRGYRLGIWQPMAVVVALDTERPASTASIASSKSRRVGSGRDLPKSAYQSSMRPR